MSTSQDLPNSPELPESSPTCKQDLHVQPPSDAGTLACNPTTSAVKETLTGPSTSDLLTWLHLKLAEAEHSVRARKTLVEGCELQKDPKYWDKLVKLPGVFTTRSRQKAPSAKALKEEEDRHRRILRKCEQEVAKIKAFIALVETLPERSAGTPARI